jgi:YggT family protein
MSTIICTLLQIAFWGIIAWVILSYVVAYGRLPSGHPVRRIYDALEKVMQPLLRPIRALIPSVRMGSVALDLSPIILILGISILRGIVC